MLPVGTEEDEIIIESRTQTAEQIEEALAGDGLEVTSKETITDGTAPVAAPVAAPQAGAPAPVAEPVSDDAQLDAEADLHGVPNADATGKRLSGAARAKIARQKLQDERDALKREVDELRQRKPAETPAPAPAAPAPAVAPGAPDPDATALPEPDPDQFDEGVLDRKYIAAVAAWDRKEAARLERVAAKETAARQVSERQAEEGRTRTAAWTAKVEAAKTAHTDYDTVMASAGNLPFSAAAHVALRESEIAPRVLYYLATHPDEAQRIFDATVISTTDPARVAARKQALAFEEVEKIEALLNQPPSTSSAKPPAVPAGAAAPSKPVPAKPVPVAPVGHGGGTSAKKYSDYSPDELREWDAADDNHPISIAYRKEFGRRPY